MTRDIVLDLLVRGLTTEQRELLLQAAVCKAAFSGDDLAYARHGQDRAAEQSRSIVWDTERLRDLTLLSPAPAGELLVHPWIAAACAAGIPTRTRCSGTGTPARCG